MKTYPPGSLIAGRYEVASHPMKGGMGIVYLCSDLSEERPVALKIFRPEYLSDRRTRDRFLREGTAWVELGRHPHIVQAYGVERIGDGKEVYLVLELIAKEEGRADASLRSWLAEGRPLPVDQALLFGLQIARGMGHAVGRIPGLVHRDLKPENLLVGRDRLPGVGVSRLRVTDFGLAKVVAESRVEIAAGGASGKRSGEELRRTRLTRVGGTPGTPLYMAREQWEGREVDVRADIYACGCILYEMLAGQPAVADEGSTLDQVRRNHCEGKLKPLPAGMPAVVRRVVECCLALRPWVRYGSWGELEGVLGAAYRELTGAEVPRVESAGSEERAERVAAGWSFSAIGVSYLDIGKAEVAKGYFERAQRVGKAEGERQLEGAGLTHLGLAYARLGDMRRAIECHEQALPIAREIGDHQGEEAALGNLGIANAALGDLHRAIEFHETALAIARENGDRRGEGNALGSLGITYARIGDVRRAIECYEQQLVITREIGDRRGESDALGNVGLAYAVLGDVRRSIESYEQQLVITREVAYRRGEGNALSNLGNAYSALGDVRRAIECYGQGLQIAREIGDRRAMAFGSWNFGLLYLKQSDPWRAVELMQVCVDYEGQIGHPDAEKHAAIVAKLRATIA